MDGLHIDAVVDGWRCIRAVLAGEPVPAITSRTQEVIEMLALAAAGWTAGQFGPPGSDGPRMALGYVDSQLAALLLDGTLAPE